MKYFEHESALSFEEAASLLKEAPKGKAVVMAGGSDLVGVLKEQLLKEYPETVINLKTIEGGEYIKEDGEYIEVGALTKLVDIVKSDVVNTKAPALAQAARSVATPLIRNYATIGGNICQDVRCWFYRYPHGVGGRLDCMRKGGNECYAIKGDNRNHSVFGGMKAHATPCTSQCPAGTDIPAYMDMIRKGEWEQAARIILRVNPMPMMTSRICPHPCQDGCNQGCGGDSVGIHCVERTLGDYILANADKFYVAPTEETGKKVAVIGAGPGGLACAYFLRKAGHEVTVIDSHEKAGGVLMYGIPHYRLPKSIVESYAKALEGMGIKFQMNTTVGKDIPTDDIVNGYDMVYFGTGAWKQPILGIHGEELTEFGLNFLVEVNSFLKNAIDDDVLVCGGGNVAMDVALTAKRMGAKNVRLVCLEEEADMPASAEEIARAKEEGIEIFNGWGLKAVVTDEDGKVTGLESMKCVSVFDENHRFAPVYDNDDVRTFEAKTILLATGQRVDTEFLGETLGAQVKTARGLFDVDEETYQTKNEKIFAGGDAVTGPNIAIRAIRAGGTAAKAMSRKLGYPITFEKLDRGFISYDKVAVKVKESAKLSELPVEARTLVDEDAMSLTMEVAAKEAGRCMNCGCYSVNASDISPVLMLLDADIITTKKTIKAVDFFTTNLKAYDMLDQDEIVKAIRFKAPENYVTVYDKFRVRESVDFAIASLAYAYKLNDGVIEDAKLVLGGVAPVPVPRPQVAKLLSGKAPNAELAEEAAELATEGTVAMEHNNYKIQEIKALVKRMVNNIK